MQDPRRPVSKQELGRLQDRDAGDNYQLVLRFRDRLLQAGTVEACYMNLFSGGVDIPPLFIGQMAHVILRNVLDSGADPLQARAGRNPVNGKEIKINAKTVPAFAAGQGFKDAVGDR